MADNVLVDNGTGTDFTVATDDDGTAHWQLTKMAFGDTTTYTRVDASNPMPVRSYVDLQKIGVSSAGLTTGATAYTIGDQTGNQFTFANAARVSGGGGIIRGITLVSAADAIGTFDVVIFDSSVTLAADNAAFAISDADALKVIDLVSLNGAFDIGNNRLCRSGPLAIPYVCSGGTSLYAALITKAAIAGSSFAAGSDIELDFYVERY